jgi:hypothetical protein
MTAVAAATQLKKPTQLYAVSTREVETPKRRRRIIPPPMHIPTEIQEPAQTFPIPDTLKTTKYTPQYEPVSFTTTTPPPTAEVPTPPAYTPVTVPKISEVPTVDVPTVPPYDVTPVPQPLPPGWWRFLPPDAFAGGSEGAYKVQSGKKQILALA